MMSIMKTKIAILLLLLFVFSSKSYAGNETPVLDIDGEMLQQGGEYYILPVIHGRGGGGLGLSLNRNKSCPYDIIQERWGQSNGIPVTFSKVGRDDDDNNTTIYQSGIQTIKFSHVPSELQDCTQSTVWKVDNYDESRGQWFVTTGGVEDPNALASQFKIVSNGGYGYRFAFCPPGCDECKQLGIYSSRFDNQRYLALTENGMPFLFVASAGDGSRRIKQVA